MSSSKNDRDIAKRHPPYSEVEKAYFFIQKTTGILVIFLGVLFGALAENIAPLFFGMFVGLPLFLTKEKVLMIGAYWNEHPIVDNSDNSKNRK